MRRAASSDFPQGERHPNARLTQEQVDWLRERHAGEGMSIRALRNRLEAEWDVSVTEQTVRNAVKGQTYHR